MGEIQEQSQKRQIAEKARIIDLHRGTYTKEEGWNPNYITLQSGKKVSRVNLLGTVVSLPSIDSNYKSISIDDGTSGISVRSFEESNLFQNIGIGDSVFVIGKPRQYGQEIYIVPEIVKKVWDSGWIKVRQAELEQEFGKHEPAAEKKDEPAPEFIEEEFEEQPPENAAQESAEKKGSPSLNVYSLIKELDKGSGAAFEEVVMKSGMPDCEKVITQLLMEGEIFEIGKGRLKILE